MQVVYLIVNGEIKMKTKIVSICLCITFSLILTGCSFGIDKEKMGELLNSYAISFSDCINVFNETSKSQIISSESTADNLKIDYANGNSLNVSFDVIHDSGNFITNGKYTQTIYIAYAYKELPTLSDMEKIIIDFLGFPNDAKTLIEIFLNTKENTKLISDNMQCILSVSENTLHIKYKLLFNYV